MSTVNGSGNSRSARPELMARLGVSYWMNLPLDIVEHKIGLACETDKVFFALLRCSLCHPHASEFAVRPVLKREGFEGWLTRLTQRIAKTRPLDDGELNDELTDNHNGKPVPLNLSDLERITGLLKRNVCRALADLRREGLLRPGQPFYIVTKPAVDPASLQSQLDILSTENSIHLSFANLNLSTGNLPDDPAERERALAWLNNLSTGYNDELQRLRTRYRETLREGSTGHSILLPIRGRKKSMHAQPSTGNSPENELEEEVTENGEQPEQPETVDPADGLGALSDLFPDEHIRADQTEELHRDLQEQLADDYHPAAYLEFVQLRRRKGRIRAGLAFDRKGLPKDFIEFVRRRREQQVPSAGPPAGDLALSDEEKRRMLAESKETLEQIDTAGRSDMNSYRDYLERQIGILQNAIEKGLEVTWSVINGEATGPRGA